MSEQDRIKTFREYMKDCWMPKDFIDWLIEQGFFSAPASIHHHGCYEGALFDHSLQVARNLEWLTEKLDLEWEREESPRIIGMFHDLCKVGNYVKGDEAWEYNNAPLLTGHGEKSVILLQQYMVITMDELLCIRWHMGAFDDSKNWNSYGLAVSACPNVLYTHVADMKAARIDGV